jgi:hypothetical protein
MNFRRLNGLVPHVRAVYFGANVSWILGDRRAFAVFRRRDHTTPAAAGALGGGNN